MQKLAFSELCVLAFRSRNITERVDWKSKSILALLYALMLVRSPLAT
jgi:hypothetical protein